MKCKICGREIPFVDKRLKYCSSEHAKEAQRQRFRKYIREHREEFNAYQREYQRKKLEAKS